MVTTEEGIIEEWTATGTHKGEFNGIPPTQREVKFRGMGKILITDGKVQEHRLYYDSREMINQLGLTFPEVLGQLPKLAWGKLQTSV
jgi:predicted ester cyclase